MEVIVEVKQTQGELRTGTSPRTGKPYAMATQDVAVFVPGEDYPVVMRADVSVPDRGDLAGQPQWYKPGRYTAKVKFAASRFGDPDIRILFRTMTPVVDAQRKAA